MLCVNVAAFVRRGVSNQMKMCSSCSSLKEMKESVKSPFENTLEVLKSKFIARVYPVSSEKEALGFVEKSRRSDPKASHHCWAYHLSGSMGESAGKFEFRGVIVILGAITLY